MSKQPDNNPPSNGAPPNNSPENLPWPNQPAQPSYVANGQTVRYSQPTPRGPPNQYQYPPTNGHPGMNRIPINQFTNPIFLNQPPPHTGLLSTDHLYASPDANYATSNQHLIDQALRQTHHLLHQQQLQQQALNQTHQHIPYQNQQNQGLNSTPRQPPSKIQFNQASNSAPQYRPAQNQVGHPGPTQQQTPSRSQSKQGSNPPPQYPPAQNQNGQNVGHAPQQPPPRSQVNQALNHNIPQYGVLVPAQTQVGQVADPPKQQQTQRSQFNPTPHFVPENILHHNLFSQLEYPPSREWAAQRQLPQAPTAQQLAHGLHPPQQLGAQGQSPQAPAPGNGHRPSQSQLNHGPEAPIEKTSPQTQQTNTIPTNTQSNTVTQPQALNPPAQQLQQAHIEHIQHLQQTLTYQLHQALTQQPLLTISANAFWKTALEIIAAEKNHKYANWAERHIAYNIASTLMLNGIYLDHTSTVNESAAWLEWAFGLKGIWRIKPIVDIPYAVPEELVKKFREKYGDGKVIPKWDENGRLILDED